MPRPGLRNVLIALVTAAGLLALTAPAASAHATLLRTSPEADDVLRTQVAKVSLTFDEAVRSPAFVTVTGPQGRVDAAPATVKGAVVTVPVRPAATVAGSYTVAYRVISDDGHPVQDRFTYQLSAPASAASASSPSSSAGPAGAAAMTTATGPSGGTSSSGRWIALAGIVVALGGAGALVAERLRGRSGPGGPP